MAVLLYRPGTGSVVKGVECEVLRADPKRLKSYLDCGWYTDVKQFPVNEPADEDEQEDDLTNEQVRARAKALGIDNWKTGRIAKLREALNGNAQV